MSILPVSLCLISCLQAILSVHQEYLAKTLTEKYTNLNNNYDKVINEANAEVDSLNQKLAGKWNGIDVTLFS